MDIEVIRRVGWTGPVRQRVVWKVTARGRIRRKGAPAFFMGVLCPAAVFDWIREAIKP
jgi:hypothetical protein